MRIVEVSENKKQYLDLLLLADEQEDMVDSYLYKGKMYVLDDDGVKCECVVTDEGNGILEIKNIATVPPFQRKGYAKALIEFLVEKYRRQFSILQVGTGDSPLTIPFYEVDCLFSIELSTIFIAVPSSFLFQLAIPMIAHTITSTPFIIVRKGIVIKIR